MIEEGTIVPVPRIIMLVPVLLMRDSSQFALRRSGMRSLKFIGIDCRLDPEMDAVNGPAPLVNRAFRSCSLNFII